MKKIFVVLGAFILIVATIFATAKINKFQRQMEALDRNMSNPKVQEAISYCFTGIVHQPEEGRR